MAQEYGGGGSRRHLIRIALKPMLATCAGLSVVVLAGWFAAEPLVRLVIPQYVDAVPAIRWALLLPWVNSFQPLNSIFNVVRRQDLYVAAMGLGIAAYVGSLMLLTAVRSLWPPSRRLCWIGRVVFMVASLPLILHLHTERLRGAGPAD